MKTKIISIAVLAFIFTALIIFSNESQSLPLQTGTGSNIGDKAPEIKLLKPDSTYLALSSFKGNIVMIDFWASWCGPCRRGNPDKVKIFNLFKDVTFKNNAKFVMFSVSLDRNYAGWTSAIKSDSLYWDNHVSDLLAWQSVAARAYGVNSIPANFLINENGIVIAKNLRGQALVDKLNELKL